MSKSAHFLIIFAQNLRVSVNFCAFLLIFELFCFCAYALVAQGVIKILQKSLKNQVSKINRRCQILAPRF